ncbi:MAG TPA: hypothetical protein VLA91_07100 [Acidimicrobiia bacterium]|nr:hypothetical protein [Acidimicrobiia bacterium]
MLKQLVDEGKLVAAQVEGHVDPGHVARELAAELTEMAKWLGLREIAIGRKGDLATQIRKEP